MNYLDFKRAADRGRYVPFNVLELLRNSILVLQHVLEAFQPAWPSLSGGVAPRFDKLVLHGVNVLAGTGVHLSYPFRLLMDGGVSSQHPSRLGLHRFYACPRCVS